MVSATSARAPLNAVAPAADRPHGRSAEPVVRSIIEQLEEAIVLGYLHPRERLVEDALIERFQAKRHAVREALAQLERMGLVERQPNRGAAVRALTPKEVEDIYAVREILEVAAARLVMHAVTPEFIKRVIQVQERHDEATRDGDPKAAFRANIEFHRAFFAACGNDQLTEAIEQFGQKAHGIRSFSLTRQEYLERSRDEHWVMIRALQEGDGEKLVAMCRDHIHVAKVAYIDAYYRRFPEQRPATR
jgi:DNA-binding GntR family transcriptional regulator